MEMQKSPRVEDVIRVRELRTEFVTSEGIVPAVDRVSFFIKRGEILGIVGESGCGKSVTALSLLRLISPPGRIACGGIEFEGKNLLQLPDHEMERVRGRKISMIFQEPMTSLNPVMSIGDQVGEGLRIHFGYSRKQALASSVELLNSVKIPDPEKRCMEYPHQLSGGMRQRAMIAMAIACKPDLLIADEPTTALDVTIQAQILDLLESLRTDFGLSILLITHALGVVAEVADRVIVMYAGKIVEEAPVRELFQNPMHPYTLGLLESVPQIIYHGAKKERLKTIEGAVPNLLNLPQGCSFQDRCKRRMEVCSQAFPMDTWINPEHRVACYLYPDESS
jgi:oligopeptide/dipeptide ABC transporter ATP-binding protein